MYDGFSMHGLAGSSYICLIINPSSSLFGFYEHNHFVYGKFKNSVSLEKESTNSKGATKQNVSSCYLHWHRNYACIYGPGLDPPQLQLCL